MAFHDLTPDQSAPPDAKSLLGLGSKFISTPGKTTGNLKKSFDRFECDFYIKVIYSGEDGDPYERDRSKLYVKSTWNPTACDVPAWYVLQD